MNAKILIFFVLSIQANSYAAPKSFFGEGLKFCQTALTTVANSEAVKVGIERVRNKVDEVTTIITESIDARADSLEQIAFLKAQRSKRANQPIITKAEAVVIEKVKPKVEENAFDNKLRTAENRREVRMAWFRERTNVSWEFNELDFSLLTEEEKRAIQVKRLLDRLKVVPNIDLNDLRLLTEGELETHKEKSKPTSQVNFEKKMLEMNDALNKLLNDELTQNEAEKYYTPNDWVEYDAYVKERQEDHEKTAGSSTFSLDVIIPEK